MLRHYLLPCSVVISTAACTAPDVETGLDAFSDGLAAIEKPLSPTLDQRIKHEESQAREAAISELALVYSAPTGCEKLVFGPAEAGTFLDKAASACELEPRIKAPVARGTAKYAADGLDTLSQYLAVLQDVTKSEVSPETSANFSGFLGSLNSFAVVADAEGGPLISDARIAPLGSLIGRAVEARRAQILRRLVNAAHPEIKKIIAELIAYVDQSSQITAQAQALGDAYARMTTAQDNGSVQQYRAAVRAYETEFDRYQAAFNKSDTARLMALWKAHQLLHAQVNGPRDPEALIALLDDLKALSD